MGSCVSHCSRQDVVHQQTGRVITDVQKSIEATSGSVLLRKSRDVINCEMKITDSNEVRDQINAEIRALRKQLVQSQVLFTYLLKNSSTEATKSPDGKKELCTLLEGGTFGDAMFQCKSFDGQVLARLYNRSNRSSSSYTSHRSTPLHCGYISLSCPTLPVDYPVVTKSTQTEPVSGMSFFISQTNFDKKLRTESNHSLNKGTPTFFSPPSTPCDTIPESLELANVCEVHKEPENPSYPRHRTNSFLSAIKDGNSKLRDVLISSEREMNESQNNMPSLIAQNADMPIYLPSQEISSCVSLPSPDICELPEKFLDENKECIFPRKLSILLEEDHEDTSTNLFSVCNSQPFLNDNKKISHSCNANTQTDFSMRVNPSLTHKQVYKQIPPKKQEFCVTETCFPREGYSIISQAVQKRTVYSVDLPQKLVFRHPPPYTRKNTKKRSYTSPGVRYFQELHSRPKTHMYKWATVGESLACKSERSRTLTVSSENSKLQTRHLSLEKQESFSSYDHNLYSDSRMASVTDCSCWITKSDVELNLRPEPPSYQQSILASQQLLRKSKTENVSPEAKPLNETTLATLPGRGMFERAKSDTDAILIDDKNDSKEKYKYSQRSMRRGSGAGSPNSQLSIPRYPAFDFSEQEDVHSIFISPSEKEPSSNIKDVSQEIQKTEKASENSHQNILHLNDIKKKNRDSSKSQTLMPEFMENSETESAKGSFEFEAPEFPLTSDVASIAVPDIAFPSLPNTFLAKLGVHKDSPLPVEVFDQQELESKFIALSLAFKTDHTTLSKRLEIHKRHRDMAEKNVEKEFQSMRDHLSALNLKATSTDVRDLISKIQNHLDIAEQATSRVSGRSETYGAVQQEERVSRAFEVLVLHVDHLKRLFDKEHKELEETRQMLVDTRIFKKDSSTDVLSEDQKKYSKTFGLPVGSIKSIGRRRASVADFHSGSFLENCKSPGFSQSWTSGLSVQNAESKLSILCTQPMKSSIDLNSKISTSPTISISPTEKSPTGINSRRCSLPTASPMVQNTFYSSGLASDESPSPSSAFAPRQIFGMKERNIWTRKLSAVTDEKEHSEDETEFPKCFSTGTVENLNENKQDKFILQDFLQQVELKNNVYYETFHEKYDEADLTDEVISDEETIDNQLQFNILHCIQNCAIGSLILYTSKIYELWHHNSTSKLFKYFCSTVLGLVALCFVCFLCSCLY